MVETDWSQILSLSQKELNPSEKDKLCENLSWMEADDIELNFSDLKSLFRLAQDILKYKNEQVNNLLGQLETVQRKNVRRKPTKTYDADSPHSTDTFFETISHQEEVINTNKEILEQLYADIAELEERKTRIEKDKSNVKGEDDSHSSRDPLSELAALEQLENELLTKNRHIRKLFTDIKVLEQENVHMKNKITILKDKLMEATQIIEKLTEQLYTLNAECSKFKDALGKSEEMKSHLDIEVKNLKQKISETDYNENTVNIELRNKIQHWKNIVRNKKAENEALNNENMQLKDNLRQAKRDMIIPKAVELQDQETTELQEKLAEAANEIMNSAKLIESLKAENKKLKVCTTTEDIPESLAFDLKSESYAGKEKEAIINKFKKYVNLLNGRLKEAEDSIASREAELSEVRGELHLLHSSKDGISALIYELKSKKRQLKLKDEEIISFVQEINTLNKLTDDLQLENETMRQQLNIPSDRNISTKGILKKYHTIETSAIESKKKLLKMESNLINLEMVKRNSDALVIKLKNALLNMGCTETELDKIMKTEEHDGGGDASNSNQQYKSIDDTQYADLKNEMQTVADENEGLRKGLQEIFEFLKDNSGNTPEALALQCPSLEAVLRSMEARHAAGWFAPHMAVMLELHSARGGREALLTALQNARKETFEVMTQLKQESQKSSELEQKLREVETKTQTLCNDQKSSDTTDISIGVFGTWMVDQDINDVDFYDKTVIENLITHKNSFYETQFKSGLEYFHKKFKVLYEKMTEFAIQTSDEQNKWAIQEENYRADIENLKMDLRKHKDDDNSDLSPGAVEYYLEPDMLQRKCAYLEESYKYIRTLNENIKNEHLDYKRDAMIKCADYENHIQTLMLRIATLSDKLRNSISLEIFLKQNKIIQDNNAKYRKLLEDKLDDSFKYSNLYKKLEQDKIEVQSICQFQDNAPEQHKSYENVECAMLKKQLETVCATLDIENNKSKELVKINENMQLALNNLIDANLTSLTKEEVDLMKEQIDTLINENKTLKEQCQHVNSQLDIALLELQDRQQRQMNIDMELNMLRHQILDLQSTGDNKAIIARLSGEILITHLQASDHHKKIERLHHALNKEKQRRVEAEEVMKVREKIFDVYASRYEGKFRYLFETIHALRQQYQGSLPLASLENYLNTVEDVSRTSQSVNDKLKEVEDLRTILQAKQNVYDELLEITKIKCITEEDRCPHLLQITINEGMHSREMKHYNTKIEILEQSRNEIMERCNYLEKTLVLINQSFNTLSLQQIFDHKTSEKSDDVPELQLEDIYSDEDQASRKSQTVSLPKPQVLRAPKSDIDVTKTEKPMKNYDGNILPGSPMKLQGCNQKITIETVNVLVQTVPTDISKKHKSIQTDIDERINDLKNRIDIVTKDGDIKSEELTQALILANQRTDEIVDLKATIINLETKLKNLSEDVSYKSDMNMKLQNTVTDLQTQLVTLQNADKSKTKTAVTEISNNLLQALKKVENEKNTIIERYKEILAKERDEYSQNAQDAQEKILDLQSRLSRSSSESTNTDAVKEIVSKYTVKIVELEDKNFKTQSDLENCNTEILSYQSELERWKMLAAERLTKMEQLSKQLEERHSHEVDSYKAENQHWLAQLTGSQQEHMELRAKLGEQRAALGEQLAEKDAHIEQMRNVIHNLKTQVLNMQTLISVNDPSFDLSAIVEVDEASDVLSQQGSDRLEIKFDSTIDLQDFNDDVTKPTTSTTVWQESLIDRLRREKQLVSKQNAILRRQIKALAGRERRARLEAQNLKNQIYRISTSGSKAAAAESAVLNNKIISLQAQLANARRDTQSNVALWDKWKRAQQAVERWQARFEEKAREVKKLEGSLNFTKSALTRLEREKRVLLLKLEDSKSNKQLTFEKRDEQEKATREATETEKSRGMVVHVSAQALMDRVEAQQRRIVALEFAEKGNEPLVTEYEKALAEITALKGQILKLESSLLESQIRSPMTSPSKQPELDYWKNYCDMLKEENMQLSLKLSSAEVAPLTSHHQRVNDLEQTVLTLRGLVSKLQSEQKSAYKRIDSSRSSSDRSPCDKSKSQLESYRIEISNLKRSMLDKDLLLEKSKEMLKIAAEREEDLLRENAYLRKHLNELKGGFRSA